MLLPWLSVVLIAFTSLAIPLFPAQVLQVPRHTNFVFDGFNGTNLILEADASVVCSESVLTLTNHSRELTLGRTLYSAPVQMKSNDTVSSFRTTFVFSIVPPPSNEGGHGLAFIMTPYTSLMGAQLVQYMGFLNRTSNGQPYSNLFVVEFDTKRNVEFEDPDRNHVGVDINNLVSVQAETAGYWNGESFQGLNLKSGRNIQAWIDYDHPQSLLNVTITIAGLSRLRRLLMSRKIDLHNVLWEKMFVGFSAATGIYVEDHYVMAWSFTTEGEAPPLDVSCLSSFANMYSERLSRRVIVGIVVAALVLFSLAIVVAVFLKRAINRETIEEWEKGFPIDWPGLTSGALNELSIATSGFRGKNVLGYGGFGMVYKGVLPSSGQEVAVKCITTEVTEGLKGFVAEISSMGRLRHRNLVHLGVDSQSHVIKIWAFEENEGEVDFPERFQI